MDISKEKYQQYANKIVSLLRDDQFYHEYKQRVKSGKNSFDTLVRRHKQIIDMTWVKEIEDSIVSLDTIVRNPRKFIVQEEDIVDISLARSISTESVKHLAQHTNMIAQVDKDGMVTPNKILNTSKEESFEIYENRFIYTLLKNVRNFVTMRFDKIKAAYAMKDTFQLSVNSNFVAANRRLTVKLDCMAQMPVEELLQTRNEDLSDVERVAKLDRIISDFLSSPFAKQMVSSAPVRPPIQRTNVILKNPDFKRALVLWGFIENYREEGFKLIDEVKTSPIKAEETLGALTDLVTLNSFIFETLAGTAAEIDESGYKDDLEILRREEPTILKPEDIAEEEEEVEEEPELPEEEQPEEEQPEEEQPEEEAPEEPEIEEPAIEEPEIEEPEEPEVQEEEPEVEPEEEEAEEITEEEQVEEEEVPEEEPEEDKSDLEFIGDDNLYPFEVKKLYKRPEEDRISPEEIFAINNALDRVLAGYKASRTTAQIDAALENREKRKSLELKAIDKLRELREKEAERLKMLSQVRRLRKINDEIDKYYLSLRELQAIQEDLHCEIAKEKAIERLQGLRLEDAKLQQMILDTKDAIDALNAERIHLQVLKAELSGTEKTRYVQIEKEELAKDEHIAAPTETAEEIADEIDVTEEEVTETVVEVAEQEETAEVLPKEEPEELMFDADGNVIEAEKEEAQAEETEIQEVVAPEEVPEEELVETPEEAIVAEEEVVIEPEETAEEILKRILPKDIRIIDELKDPETLEPLKDDAQAEDVLSWAVGEVDTDFTEGKKDFDIAPYDFTEEDSEDKFLLARKMIKQRFVVNRVNHEDAEEAKKILDSILRDKQSARDRKSDD